MKVLNRVKHDFIFLLVALFTGKVIDDLGAA